MQGMRTFRTATGDDIMIGLDDVLRELGIRSPACAPGSHEGAAMVPTAPWPSTTSLTRLVNRHVH
jgi:hypothetical protein